jgi:aspartyl-tRNA(Asn)/glutamyl-tRNA(Gln) amidotransferase subunit A
MISCLPTIAKAVQQIREGELTSAELVEFCLERIDRYEPSLAAWVCVDSDGARRQAARLDQMARKGQLSGLLHGIPIGIKDIIDVAGWPTKAGSPTRADHAADADAQLVRGLRREGAIILGKTVTTEFACFDPARTRNPWNTDRTPGGSSSGSAAATAAQMCMAAIGTQTGGSIIRPASYCGLCGLKPTLGQVSLNGVVPISGHLDHGGPLARTVRDAARVFFSLVTTESLETMWCYREGEDILEPEMDEPGDVTAASLDWLLFERPESVEWWVDLQPLAGYFEDAASDGVLKCFRTAIDQMGNFLRIAPPLPLPGSFEKLHERHHCIMAVDAAAYHRAVFSQRPDDFGPNMTSLIEAGLTKRAVDYTEAVACRLRFRDDMSELLGNNALAITPSTTMAAPSPDTTGDPAFNTPWSFAGLPTITIPCGVDDDGLPCGLQIVGPPNSELRVLRAGWVCEQALGFSHSPQLG